MLNIFIIRDVVSKVTTRVDSSFELKLSPLSVIFQKNHKLETQTQLDRRIFRQTRNSNFRTWVNSISINFAVNSDYFSKLGQFLDNLHLKLYGLINSFELFKVWQSLIYFEQKISKTDHWPMTYFFGKLDLTRVLTQTLLKLDWFYPKNPNSELDLTFNLAK